MSRPQELPLSTASHDEPRHDWTRAEIRTLFGLPFPDLLFRTAQVHRENFDPTEVQISTLFSIKTGACAEDCSYCSQSAHYHTALKP
jgi:biotin synthase